MTETTRTETAQAHDHNDDHRDPDRGLLTVHFLDLNTNEHARFAVPSHLTLQRAWDMAYDELGEKRRPSDVLETKKGDNLTADLGKTIEEIKRHVEHDLHFQIHGEQGGA